MCDMCSYRQTGVKSNGMSGNVSKDKLNECHVFEIGADFINKVLLHGAKPYVYLYILH